MDPQRGQPYHGDDEALAYGDYHGAQPDPAEVAPEGEDFDGPEGERGIIGDTYRKVRDKYQQNQGNSSTGSKPSGGLGSFIFHKLHEAVNEIGSKIDPNVTTGGGSSNAGPSSTGAQSSGQMQDNHKHRYNSFAEQRSGNDAKWYVDGCGYMWAVSRALEQATTSIWILDCECQFSRIY